MESWFSAWNDQKTAGQKPMDSIPEEPDVGERGFWGLDDEIELNQNRYRLYPNG